jgi:hypothetical protein
MRLAYRELGRIQHTQKLQVSLKATENKWNNGRHEIDNTKKRKKKEIVTTNRHEVTCQSDSASKVGNKDC